MPPIFVWAVVTDPRGVLLVPARNADAWVLPGGPLLEGDDTVEEAIARELRTRFGVALAEEPEFLDTQYERREDGTTIVHNLFHVPSDRIEAALPEAGAADWLAPDAVERAPLPGWLRRALASLFSDEEPSQAFELSQIEAALGGGAAVPPVIVVTGPAGAGKSTVSRELCRRFPRAAHVEVDLLRHMVASDYVSPRGARPGGESSPDAEEASRQTWLALQNGVDLARNFVGAGFTVVLDDIVETRERLDALLGALGPGADVRFVTLLPDRETLARRDGEREPDARMGARSEEHRQMFATNGETRGLRLDSSQWTPERSVDIILERLDEARVALPWEAGS